MAEPLRHSPTRLPHATPHVHIGDACEATEHQNLLSPSTNSRRAISTSGEPLNSHATLDFHINGAAVRRSLHLPVRGRQLSLYAASGDTNSRVGISSLEGSPDNLGREAFRGAEWEGRKCHDIPWYVSATVGGKEAGVCKEDEGGAYGRTR